jgi:hypothetical protein
MEVQALLLTVVLRLVGRSSRYSLLPQKILEHSGPATVCYTEDPGTLKLNQNISCWSEIRPYDV